MAAQSQPRTLPELFNQCVSAYAHQPYLVTRTANGWTPKTYAETSLLVDSAEHCLVTLGVEHGDRVAIISNNRLEWAVLAHACYRIGAIFVPMYEAQDPADRTYIINDCRPKVVFAANDAIADAVYDQKVGQPEMRWLITFGPHRKGYDPLATMNAAAVGDPNVAEPIRCYYGELRDVTDVIIGMHVLRWETTPPVIRRPEPDDVACLIYTSGTTGAPKGVMQTHGNIVSNVTAVGPLGFIRQGDRSLSFLPWAHTFGHTAELHAMAYRGGTVYICEGVKKLKANAAEVKPQLLCSVPLIFENAYNDVKAQADKSGFGKWLFAAGLKAHQSTGLLSLFVLMLADLFIFRKVRKALGGELRVSIVGGAKFPQHVGEFMEACGIPVCEGYGATETSPVVAVNKPADRKLGTVGKPIEGVEIKILPLPEQTDDPDEGEILVRGPNVTLGYYNKPDKTAERFRDGWYHTGDLGKLLPCGRLKVECRIDQLFKLANGKFVDFESIEDAVKRLPWVTNAMLCGQGKESPSILVAVNKEKLLALFKEQFPALDAEALLANPEVRRRLLSLVKEASDTKVAAYERVKHLVLVGEDFTHDNGLLTPTLKLKRVSVARRYATQIENAYA